MHLENSFCVAYTVKANFLEACENKGSAVEWEVELNSHPGVGFYPFITSRKYIYAAADVKRQFTWKVIFHLSNLN